MERMSKEKESGTLLGVGTAYLPVKEIKGEFYVKVSDFTRCMDGIRIEQEADRKHIEELKEENKKLKEEIEKLNLHIEAKDKAYMSLLKDYEELKYCGRYVFDCSKYDFTWLTSTTPQLEVSKKSESGSCFTKIE